MGEARRDEEMAEAIRGYLAEHPQAMDTTEGIAEWWLMRQEVRASVATVARVLRRLTDSGVVEEITAGERKWYRLKS